MLSGHCLAIDIGGTKAAAALVDGAGNVLIDSVTRCRTGAVGTADFLGRLEVLVRTTLSALPDRGWLVGVGIGCAGPIDATTGTTYCANLPGLAGVDLREFVSSLVPVALADDSDDSDRSRSVTLGPDGMCAALAEQWVGAARHAKNSMAVVVSTGIGGGIVLDGRPLRGKSGNCGHIGQIQIASREPGRTSLMATLDYLASGPATVLRAVQEGWRGQTGFDLARDAAEGNPVALAAVRRSACLVGETLAGMCALLDLEVVTVGGGFSNVTPNYVEIVADTVRECAFMPHAVATLVRASSLGKYGPLVGAAALTFRPFDIPAAAP